MRLLLLFTLSWSSLFSQRLSIAVIAGTNLTDPFSRYTRHDFGPSGLPLTIEYKSVSPALILGPTVELLLGAGWSVEVDALHRELRSEARVGTPPGPSQVFSQQTRASWEFPLLAKYTIGQRAWRPFLNGGMSFRPAGTGTGLSHRGITAGAGIDAHWKRLRVSPSVRYTRWADPGNNFALPPARRDHVEFLVTFTTQPASQSSQSLVKRIHAGVLAGFAPGDDFTSNDPAIRPESNSPVAGIGVAANVTSRFDIEVDGLYRPLHGSDQGVRFATLTWEFPVLAKYRLRATGAQPFVEAGPSFRAIGNLNLPELSHVGFTAGGGIEWKWRRLRIGPLVRYTRWQDSKEDSRNIRAAANQTEVLFAVFF